MGPSCLLFEGSALFLAGRGDQGGVLVAAKSILVASDVLFEKTEAERLGDLADVVFGFLLLTGVSLVLVGR